jgi:hypothetical protein
VTDELKALVGAWQRFDPRCEQTSDSTIRRLRRSSRRLNRALWPGQVAKVFPRSAQTCLRRSSPATEANAGLYSGDVKARIMDAAYELQELIIACVAVNEAELNELMEE